MNKKLKQLAIPEVLKEASEKIKDFRYQQRMTLYSLSLKCGYPRTLLSQLERGIIKNITLEKLIDIMNACGLVLSIRLD